MSLSMSMAFVSARRVATSPKIGWRFTLDQSRFSFAVSFWAL